MCLLFYSKGWKKKHGTYRIAAACGRPVYGCLRRIGLQGPRDAEDQLQKLRHLRRLVRRLQFVFPILLLSLFGLGCCEAVEPLRICHKRILRFLPQIPRWCPDFSYGTPLRSAVPQTEIKKHTCGTYYCPTDMHCLHSVAACWAARPHTLSGIACSVCTVDLAFRLLKCNAVQRDYQCSICCHYGVCQH